MNRKVFFRTLAVCIILSSIVTSSTFNIAAAEVKEKITMQRIAQIREETLEVTNSFDGLKYQKITENIDAFSNELRETYPSMSDYELGKAVLMSLGDSEEFIETLPREKVVEALEYTSAIQEEIYLHESASGELKAISKELFYSTDTATNAAQSDIPFEQNFGEIILRSSAFRRYPSYSLTDRNYYTIRGEIEWVGYANCKFKDLLAISSTGNIDNQYSHYANGVWDTPDDDFYTEDCYLSDSSGLIHLYTPSVHGLGAEFDIQAYVPSLNRVSTVRRVTLYYGISMQSDVSCQVAYAHGIIAWDPSFSVDTGSISFGGLSPQREVFSGRSFTLYHE